MAAFTGFNSSRFELGRMLKEYRLFFARDTSFKALLIALDLPRQSGYDMLADYERGRKREHLYAIA